MATSISTNGKKKLKTLKKEFNEKFPYLRLVVCPLTERGNNPVKQFDYEKTLAEARTASASGEISIHGKTKVKTLESDFEKLFGMYVEVGFVTNDGKRFFSGQSFDDLTLTALNIHGEKNGWQPGIWE